MLIPFSSHQVFTCFPLDRHARMRSLHSDSFAARLIALTSISTLHPSLRFSWILRESLRLLEFPLLLPHFSCMLAVRGIIVRLLLSCSCREPFCDTIGGFRHLLHFCLFHSPQHSWGFEFVNHLGPASHFAPALLFFVILPQGCQLNCIHNYAGSKSIYKPKYLPLFVTSLCLPGVLLPLLSMNGR